MGYYKMKCPYCLSKILNNEVLFKKKASIAAPSENVSSSTPKERSKDGKIGGVVYNDNPSSNDYSPPKSYNDLYKYDYKLLTCKELNEEHPKDIVINKGLESKDKVLVPDVWQAGTEVLTQTIDILSTGERCDQRHCPKCHKELSKNAGIMPTFVILMLGPSGAGKTTYLLSLLEKLGSTGIDLPPKGSGAKKIAGVKITASSVAKSGDSLEKRRENLYNYGALPGTTQVFTDNEPIQIVVKVSFENQRQGREHDDAISPDTSALLYIRDVPGEWLISKEKENRLKEVLDIIKDFDGFIMILDPFTFDRYEAFDRTADNDIREKAREKIEYINRLDKMLTNEIAPLFKGGIIRKPTAVIITKGDHLLAKENVSALEKRGIIRSNCPTLTEKQKESFDKAYFNEINSDTLLILDKLADRVSRMVKAHFSDLSYSIVSSLGKKPIDIIKHENTNVKRFGKNGKSEIFGPGHFIKNENDIWSLTPWRTSDPFLRLLMQFHILPPYNKIQIRKLDIVNDPSNQKARNFTYTEELNTWGNRYVARWRNYTENLLDTE